MKMYRPRRYYGKLKSMESVEDDMEGIAEVICMKDVTTVVQAIQTNDLDLLESLLNTVSGKNLSDILVSVTLPKQWHSIAKTVKSTPLRTAISWRNLNAMDIILGSKCVVMTEDISLGLQKILRHADTDIELEIIGRLVRHGAEMDNPAAMTMAFERILQAGNANQCMSIVKTICKSHPRNSLLGMLLLAVSKHSAKYQHNYCQSRGDFIESETSWQQFTRDAMRRVLLTDFSCYDFMMDTKVWLTLSSISFQYLVHALPLIVQVSSHCPQEALGWLLRQVGRNYGHTSVEGKQKISQLPELLQVSGVNLTKVMSVACLSPRFMQESGFASCTQNNNKYMSSLQNRCKVVIRANITTGNVYSAMEGLNIIPKPMKDFILLREVQPFPWDN